MDPELQFDRQQFPRLFAPARISRRGFIAMGAGALGTAAAAPASAGVTPLMCPPKVGVFGGGYGDGGGGAESLVEGDYDFSGATPDDGPGLRTLKMYNPHTRETFEGDIVVDGEFNQEVLAQFSRFARDWRQNEVKPFSPTTINIIWTIWRELNMDEPFSLNSGYRSPKTNASLDGAATQSLHLKAMAADLSCSTRSVAEVHKIATQIGGGGVGRYNTFVHVDSGRVRYWSG